ncbi:MAG: PDZ domain-containing protein [Planctomycetales bacterium]|nr:PDZ domain-containing protein [Planctomycetales bacterium]
MRGLSLGSWVVVLAVWTYGVPVGAEDPAGPPPEPRQGVVPAGAGGGPQEGPLWIGVVCYPAPEALRAQLKLPAGQGLVVSDVAPDSPAAAAGIRRHDVLLRAGERELAAAADLMEHLGRHGRQPVAVQILRAGERLIVEVTPAVRPEEQRGAVFLPGADRQALREFMERLDPNIDLPLNRRRLRLRFLHPGLILESGPEDRPWPADLSVSVTREGNQPTKITVRRGEETWEIDRQQLEKLPEMIRPFVQGMLGESAGGSQKIGRDEIELPFEVPAEVDLPKVQLPEGEDLPSPAEEGAAEGAAAAPDGGDRRARLGARLEAIERQLQQLRGALQEAEGEEDADR